MGEAWKAFDETAQRYVVLKFVPKDVQHVSAAMDAVRLGSNTATMTVFSAE